MSRPIARFAFGTAAILAVAALQPALADDKHHPAPQAQQAKPAPGGQMGMMDGGGMMSMPMMQMMMQMMAAHHGQAGMGPMMGSPGSMMPMMMGSGGMMSMMGMGDHVEGRIAFLKAELQITDAQATAWDKFADALRTNAGKMGSQRQMMMQQGGDGDMSPVDRLGMMEQQLAAHLETVRSIHAALADLYPMLSEAQKETFGTLLHPRMAMGAGGSGMPMRK